jgi:hypothetical protein
MVHRKRDLDQARAEHDREIDPDAPRRDDDLVVYARREDRSLLWKASWYMQKFLPIWAPIVWVLTALGFGFVTPTKKADELKAQLTASAETLQRQIDSLRVAQLKISEKQDDNERALNVLVRQACIDRRVPRYDKQMIGLLDAKGECIR